MRLPFWWTHPKSDMGQRPPTLLPFYQSNQILITTPRHCPDFCVSHRSITFTSDSHHQLSSPRTVSHYKTRRHYTHTALPPQLCRLTPRLVIAASSHYCRLLCIPCHRLPSIAMTTPQITLNDTGQLDSSGDTQEHAAAQPGQSEGEAEVRIL